MKSLNKAQALQQKKESKTRAMWNLLCKNKGALAGLIIVAFLAFIAIFGSLFTPYDATVPCEVEQAQAPSAAHWFGVDNLGKDIFSRIVVGTKVSLTVGLFAVSMSLIVGMILGAAAAYRGGMTDTIIMRSMDMLLSIPSMLMAISLVVALGAWFTSMFGPHGKTVIAVLAIAIVAVPEYARIVYGCVRSEKENDYIQAAKIIGNNDFAIVFRHIIPNITPAIIVRATLGVSTAILNTAALGFLGLGVQPPYPEWGQMLSDAHKGGFHETAPYMLIFPGAAIALTVFAFNLLGDGLRDILDPKSHK